MPGPASLRAGFDYQDLVAIREIMHLLRHPEQVNVIELEADEVGSFDDVRVQYTSGSERRLQVKFAVDPADEWTWDALMEVPGPTTTRTGRPRRARPLLYKWFDSLRDGPETAVGEIITNRRPAPDLARALGSDGQILFDTIPSEVRTDLANRYGDVEARSIATRLRFHLEQLGLEELEAQVKRDFADIVNSAAYPQFKDRVRGWGAQQIHRRGAKVVDIDEARRASGFYELVPLPERLDVPPDFVIPDRDFDRYMGELLGEGGSDLILLEGDAGSGKSTYVSDLYRRLRTPTFLSITA